MLRLQVQIVNMVVPAVEIRVELGDGCGGRGESNRLEFLFLTELGRVAVDIDLIEEIYLVSEEEVDEDEKEEDSGVRTG